MCSRSSSSFLCRLYDMHYPPPRIPPPDRAVAPFCILFRVFPVCLPRTLACLIDFLLQRFTDLRCY